MLSHSRMVFAETKNVMMSSMDVQNAARSFLITGLDTFLVQTNLSIDSTQTRLSRLQSFFVDHPDQKPWVDSLSRYIQFRIDRARYYIRMKELGQSNLAMESISSQTGQLVTNKIREFSLRIEENEMNLLVQRRNFFFQFMKWLSNSLYFFLFLLAILSLFLYSRVSRGLRIHQETEEKFRSLVEAAPDALIISDMHGTIQVANYKAEEVFGYTQAELIGQKVEILLPESRQQKHQTQRQEYLRQRHLRLKEGGRELPGRKKDGTLFMTEITLSPIEFGEEVLIASSIRDITTKIEARRALESLSMQVNQAHESIYTLDTGFMITSWNKGAQQLFGYTKEEALRMNGFDMIYNPDPQWTEQISTQLIQQDSWTGEVVKKRKDGSPVELFSSVTSIRNEKGELAGFLSVSHEIGLQKSLEKQLKQNNEQLEEKVRIRTEEIRRSEQKYKYLFHHNPIPMWIIETSTFRFLDVNEMAVQKYGYSRDEFLAMTAEDIRPEGTKEAFRRDNNPKLKQLTDGFRGVWQHRKKDGNLIWVEIIAHHIQFEGKQARLILANDITEKKEAQDLLSASEKRFRAMIEYNYDMIAMMDAEGNVIYRSPSAFRMTGMTNEEASQFRFFEDIVHPEDKDRLTRLFQDLLKNPGQPMRAHYRGKHKDGHYIFVEGTLTNLLDEPAVHAIIFNFRDVTLERLAADKLIASEKRYRETLDNMLEGVQIVGFDWRYLYVNDAVVKQSRTKREDLIGYSMMERFPGIEETELYSVFSKCFNERSPQHLENKFVYPDGSVAWFDLSFQPVPEGVFVLSIDITDRVNAIQALKEERDKLASISLASPGVFFSFRSLPNNRGSYFTYVSHAFQDMFGYPFEILDTPEATGELFASRFWESCPDDGHLILSAIETSAKNLTVLQMEFRYNHLERGPRWMHVHALPAREGDGGTIWHGIVMDTTESKRKEEKILEQSAQLTTLSNNLPGVMIFQLTGKLDGSRQFTFVSEEVSRLTGHTPAEVMENPMILYDLIGEEYQPLMQQKELESYQELIPFQVEIKTKPTPLGERWLQIVSTPRSLSNGTIVWDGFHVDITERKQIEERINNLNAELEEKVRLRTEQLQRSNEELEAFTYSVSHDLRAPLRGIIGFTDILEQDYASQLDEEARRITGIIKANTQKMGDLIDDLLTFSRQGRHEIEKVPFDTQQMVSEVIQILESGDEKGRIQWEINTPHGSFGDITSLRQVWVNLIGNAIKYTRGRENPKISIRTRQEGRYTHFSIQDNGVGFDQKYASKLFKVFQRLHGVDEFDGTGVGLAIVEKIVSKHEGKVWAEGKEGQGATFTFSLPDQNHH